MHLVKENSTTHSVFELFHLGKLKLKYNIPKINYSYKIVNF